MTTMLWQKVPYEVLQRQHYRVDGKPKRAFPNYHSGMNFLRMRGEASVKRAYRCGVCTQFHVGRKKRGVNGEPSSGPAQATEDA